MSRRSPAPISSPLIWLFFAATVPVAGAVSGYAASDPVCTDYAQRAVAQNAENERMGCGFRGPRWHGGETGHFIFCKTASDQFVHSELNTRAGKLRECQAMAAGQDDQQGAGNNDQANDDAVLGRQHPEFVGGAGGQDAGAGNNAANPGVATPGQEVLVDTAVECKARRVTISAEHESSSEAERLSLTSWEEIVGSSYGSSFSDINKAKEAELNCAPAGEKTQCSFSGFPCNG